MLVVRDVVHKIEFEKKDINLFYSIYADSDSNASEFKVTAFRSKSESEDQTLINSINILIKEFSDDEPASTNISVYYTNNINNSTVVWVSHKIVKGLTLEAFAARIKEIFEDTSIKGWSKAVFGDFVMFTVPSNILAS